MEHIENIFADDGLETYWNILEHRKHLIGDGLEIILEHIGADRKHICGRWVRNILERIRAIEKHNRKCVRNILEHIDDICRL